MSVPFQIGTASHFAASAASLALVFAWILVARRLDHPASPPQTPHPTPNTPPPAPLPAPRKWLAILLLASVPASCISSCLSAPGGFSGVSWPDLLPLHVCDVLCFVAAYALWSRQNWALALTYYLGLGASLQGLITPALNSPFPAPLFFSFFLSHALLVTAALYVPVILRWRASWTSALRTFLLLNLYALFTLLINPILHTNFAFTAYPPPGGSLIDLLGPWPWYLLSLQPVALALLSLLTLLNLPRPHSPS